MPLVSLLQDLADGEDDYTGISAPLYALVDSLFQLQSRGFFRQGVYSIARQALSLIAGSAIDEALVRQLNYIKQEHTIARLILRLQTSLWPGGRWFMTVQAAIAPGQVGCSHWLILHSVSALLSHGGNCVVVRVAISSHHNTNVPGPN